MVRTYRQVKIEDHPDVIETINRALSLGSMVEIKIEAGQSLTVVQIDRKLLKKEQTK